MSANDSPNNNTRPSTPSIGTNNEMVRTSAGQILRRVLSPRIGKNAARKSVSVRTDYKRIQKEMIDNLKRVKSQPSITADVVPADSTTKPVYESSDSSDWEAETYQQMVDRLNQ